IPDRLLANARRSAALLRLAVLLHRSRDSEALPSLQLHADGDQLTLSLDRDWLQARTLLRADLDGEINDIRGLGMQLRLGEA
ncbi:MAG: exopolyphosphatase, partial [Thermomonas sp.]